MSVTTPPWPTHRTDKSTFNQPTSKTRRRASWGPSDNYESLSWSKIVSHLFGRLFLGVWRRSPQGVVYCVTVAKEQKTVEEDIENYLGGH